MWLCVAMVSSPGHYITNFTSFDRGNWDLEAACAHCGKVCESTRKHLFYHRC